MAKLIQQWGSQLFSFYGQILSWHGCIIATNPHHPQQLSSRSAGFEHPSARFWYTHTDKSLLLTLISIFIKQDRQMWSRTSPSARSLSFQYKNIHESTIFTHAFSCTRMGRNPASLTRVFCGSGQGWTWTALQALTLGSFHRISWRGAAPTVLALGRINPASLLTFRSTPQRKFSLLKTFLLDNEVAPGSQSSLCKAGLSCPPRAALGGEDGGSGPAPRAFCQPTLPHTRAAKADTKPPSPHLQMTHAKSSLAGAEDQGPLATLNLILQVGT